MIPLFLWAVHQGAEPHRDAQVDVLDYTLIHKEGEVAYMSIQIADQQSHFPFGWMELYYDLQNEGENLCVFKGRLTALPEWVKDGVVRLIFAAVPPDLSEGISSVCMGMRESDTWDPLFFSAEEGASPRHMLKDQTAYLYFDRVTHGVGISDIFQGRKRATTQDMILAHTFSLKKNQMPWSHVDVCVQAEWVQQAEGEFNLFPLLERRFPRGLLNTFTPFSLEGCWPKVGQSLGRSGYQVIASELVETPPPSTGVLNLYPTFSAPIRIRPLAEDSEQQGGIVTTRLRRYWYTGTLKIGWSYNQKRLETIGFRVVNGHQMSHTIKGKKIALRLQQITVEDPDQKKRSTFFDTDRGRKAINFAIRMATAYLAGKARCLIATFQVPLSVGINWCPDTSLTVNHQFFPDGQATGKVMEVVMHHGPDGAVCRVRVGFSLGRSCLSKSPRENPPKNEGDQKDSLIFSYGQDGYTIPEPQDDFSVCALGPVQGVVSPQTQRREEFVQEIILKNHGDHQAQFVQENQYPVFEDVREHLKDLATEITISLQDLRTTDGLERHYKLNQDIVFYPPCDVILQEKI